MTAFVKLAHLFARVISAVEHSGAHARTVRELFSFLEDLRCQLACRCEDEAERILLATVVGTIRGGNHACPLFEHSIQDGNEKCGGFAVNKDEKLLKFLESSSCFDLPRSGLSTRHEIPSSNDYRDRVLLHRCRLVVARHFDVLANDVGQLNVIEGCNVLGNILARRLHGNVFVLIEIDAGVGCAKQLEFDAFISWQWNRVVDVTTSTVPLSTVSAAAAASAVIVVLLRRFLPACIDGLGFVTAWRRLLERNAIGSWLLGRGSLAAEAVVSARRARESTRTSAAVVPIAAAIRVSVLVAIIIIVIVEIRSAAAAVVEVTTTLIVLTTAAAALIIVVVEATIIITTRERVSERGERKKETDERLFFLRNRSMAAG